ncbi:hypothetical protein J6590_108481 [Homalodisca vitripennis]|nr:hypothetical protein J6590_108481 [Homalodisca vitripennis]
MFVNLIKALNLFQTGLPLAMENLPVEMVENIAQYLTTKELAACCATSRVWRDIFGEDSIWKYRCNTHIAKYLATAESRVNPQFVIPECMNVENSLNPLGEWRLSYLREQLLWSHWKSRKQVTEHLTLIDQSEPEKVRVGDNALCHFVTDNYLITSNEKRVMLWDVRNCPVYVSDPFKLLSSNGVDFCLALSNDKILIVQKTLVQIYYCGSPMNSNWSLEQNFLFDRSELISLSKTEEMVNFPLTFSNLVIGNYFVGILSSGEMHIWDLASGTKMKKVSYPGSMNDEIIKVVSSMTPPTDIVVVIQRNSMYHFFVFCFASLDFYPFTTSHDNQRFPSCAIQNGLLAISLNGHFKVFDYRTSQLALVVPAEYSVGVLTLDSSFLFISKNTVHVFNTITASFESVLLALIDPFEDINSITDITCNKFLITSHFSGEIAWELDFKSSPMKMTNLRNFNVCYDCNINKACTKVAGELWEGSVEVISYW